MEQFVLTFITALIILGCVDVFRRYIKIQHHRIDAYLVGITIVSAIGLLLFGILVTDTTKGLLEASRNILGFSGSITLLVMSVAAMAMDSRTQKKS